MFSLHLCIYQYFYLSGLCHLSYYKKVYRFQLHAAQGRVELHSRWLGVAGQKQNLLVGDPWNVDTHVA